MPVNPAQLSSALASNFANPGTSAAACAQQWTDAVGGYAAAVVPPSTTIAAAKSALAGGLAGAFAIPGGAIPGMESAFLSFATALGGGMAPFVAAPPPTPIGFAAQFAGSPLPTPGAAAGVMASLIDAWFRKGTATPPGGSPIPWT